METRFLQPPHSVTQTISTSKNSDLHALARSFNASLRKISRALKTTFIEFLFQVNRSLLGRVPTSSVSLRHPSTNLE
ncbi:hypothetical protein VUR80DRAFT_8729 [Thermomyces stellatus]